MQAFPPTVVIRHRLENLKKCSLRGLEARKDFHFITYPFKTLPPIDSYVLLSVDAPPLTEQDHACGLLLLDATWRYAAKMVKPFLQAPGLIYRSLPHHYRTAYPRKQDDCPDPERGLASIEALYLSYLLMGRPTDGLLDQYYWKESFLKINGLII
ncbi:MAG: hypothetical protein LW832_02600 [Parachlamydia sp.]|jgi:pre-rRNA-processing protein TSR3|nr:hypothetical protein [Parachlamydia sp.]